MLEATVFTMIEIAMAVLRLGASVSSAVMSIAVSIAIATDAANTASVDSVVVVIDSVLINASESALIVCLIVVVNSILVNAADIIIVLLPITEVSSMVSVVDSVLVDVSGTVTIGVAEASDCASLVVLLSEVRLVTIAVNTVAAVDLNAWAAVSVALAANGTMITVGESILLAIAAVGKTTIASVSTVVSTLMRTAVSLRAGWAGGSPGGALRTSTRALIATIARA